MYLKKLLYKTMRSLLKYTFSVFLVFIVFFSLPKAWAGFSLEFKPLLISEERYTDNLFLSSSNKRSDWITTISPGFAASLSHRRFTIDLQYHPNFVYFLHNPKYDTTGHSLDFKAAIEITPRLIFSLSETYRLANDISYTQMLETDYERDARRDTLDDYNINTIAPQLEYRFGRENLIRLYYRNSRYRSDDPTEDEYRESFIESELEYWFNSKNGINFLFHYTKGNFDLDTDLLNSVNISTRYMYRFTRQFELYGDYSVGVSDFEDTRFFEGLDERRVFQTESEDFEDYDLRKFNVGFEWQLKRNLEIEGSIGYYWRQGVGNRDDEGISSLFQIEKSTRNLTVNLKWESGYTARYFSLDDSGSSEFWSLSTNATYNYHKKLEFSFRGSYGYDDYTDFRERREFARERREEYIYRADTSITYHIVENYGFLSDLSLEMLFNHTEQDSTSDDDRYIRNQYIARITATF